MKKKGNWTELSDVSYSPIEQGVVVLNQERKNDKDALDFFEFLMSSEAKEILTKFGYAVNEQTERENRKN